jgi:uncharacterized membrane protein HdeD (DUF308 family)
LKASQSNRLSLSPKQGTSSPPEAFVTNSKQIGALLGPTMVVMLIAEFPLVQPHLYDDQIPSVIYLSGILMFVAGLAIVRVHNVWARDWTVLITLSGWSFLVLGLVRIFAASRYHQAAQAASSMAFMALEGFLLAVALVMTFKAYRRTAP